MTDTQKTHAEIIADMRYKMGVTCPWQVNGGTCELCPLGHSPHGRDLGKYCSFHKLANELDAAHKREIDEAERRANHAAMKNVCETLAKVGPLYDAESIGDAAKLREALEYMFILIDGRHLVLECETTEEISGVQGKLAEARAALEAPARNCDMGTAEEQAERHYAWCRKHSIDGDNKVNCAHPDMSCDLCTLRWAQMPYEEGGNDGK